MIYLYVVILLKIMWSNSPLMLATIMREEEIRALFIFLCYLKCKLLIIIFIGHRKAAATYSHIKFQCIGRGLGLKVNGFKFCGVLLMLSNNISLSTPLDP